MVHVTSTKKEVIKIVSTWTEYKRQCASLRLKEQADKLREQVKEPGLITTWREYKSQGKIKRQLAELQAKEERFQRITNRWKISVELAKQAKLKIHHNFLENTAEARIKRDNRKVGFFPSV